MNLSNLLGNATVVAVICNQWGDTGKGKLSDLIATEWPADVTARGTGANNAGHTVEVNGQQRIFHLIPAGITNDANGQVTVLGNGMLVDLKVLTEELDELATGGLSYDNLLISRDAQVILPIHIARDQAIDASQSKGGIGTTGRGIGPCYTDKIARRGVFVRDLYVETSQTNPNGSPRLRFDGTTLAEKVTKLARHYPEQEIDTDRIIGALQQYAEQIAPFVADTVTQMQQFWREGKRILLEGAQGLLLSIEHGTSPYVTSSDSSLNGTATGVGLGAHLVDVPIGVVKFPIMTRVGGGPFPTELGGTRSERYCANPEITQQTELKEQGIPFEVENGIFQYDHAHPRILELINSSDPFEKGIGFRLAANEYGATTGRPRRIGWTDLEALRYAVPLNGERLFLTKPDVVAGADEFKLGSGYNKGGPENAFQRDPEFLRTAQVNHVSYTGYGNIHEVRRFEDLPDSLLAAISIAEDHTHGKVVGVSVGADREATIIR